MLSRIVLFIDACHPFFIKFDVHYADDGYISPYIRGEEETDLSLGSSFSAETNRRDEDADMYDDNDLLYIFSFTAFMSNANITDFEVTSKVASGDGAHLVRRLPLNLGNECVLPSG